MTLNIRALMGAPAAAKLYVEDVFSSWLYTGNGSNLTVGNGMALTSAAGYDGVRLQDGTFVGISGMATDPSGNIYMVGNVGGSTPSYALVSKYTAQLTLVWQRKISMPSGSLQMGGIAVDSSSNVYIGGGMTSVGFLVKLDSSGIYQWYKEYYSNPTRVMDVKVDSSGNPIVYGYDNNQGTGVQTAYLIKYNSSGTEIWGARYTYGTYANPSKMALDSSNNIYICGNGANSDAYIAKFNSSGVYQWNLIFTENTGGMNFYDIDVDSSGNPVVVGISADGTTNLQQYGIVAKVHSSGYVMWQRGIDNSSSNVSSDVGSVRCGSDGSIYISGGSGSTTFTVKLDTNGSTVWTRRHTGGGMNPRIVTSTHLYTASYVSSSALIFRISNSNPDPFSIWGLTTGSGTVTNTTGGMSASSSGGSGSTFNSFPGSARTFYSDAGTATVTNTSAPAIVSQGGMVWLKERTSSGNNPAHWLFDTARGGTYSLSTDTGGQFGPWSPGMTFSSSGFQVGNIQFNSSNANYASWTFRKARKFFDVVTGTGGGTFNHSLGTTPGMILFKLTNGASSWYVHHRSTSTQTLYLNTTGAASGSDITTATSTTFTTSNFAAGSDQWVAYLFAHDTTADGIIQCGSYTGTGAAGNAQNLGWEPQWMLIKKSAGGVDDWFMFDNMRGVATGAGDATMYANSTSAENTADRITFNSNGFEFPGSAVNNSGSTYVYMAIRRGPMRAPTSGTNVFSPNVILGNGSTTTGQLVSTGFPVDTVFQGLRTSGQPITVFDRQRGIANISTNPSKKLITSSTGTEVDDNGPVFNADQMTGYKQYGYSASFSPVSWNFRRAPSFFDVVCYTGTSGAATIKHNLGVAPELILVKSRLVTTGSWFGYAAPVWPSGGFGVLKLETTDGAIYNNNTFNNTAPTASVFSVESNINSPTVPYVAYLFATCPGVSKVGSYTGNGSSRTINCGFTAGARFIMIKRTDSTGDWYVWDTARGIVAANDPHLSLNTTAAEVTTNDSIDTDNTGFIVNQVAATNINVNNATYIYLAIA